MRTFCKSLTAALLALAALACYAQEAAVFTRPANTTAYAAGDVVCNSTSACTLMTFTAVQRISGAGYIVGARLSTNAKSIVPRIRVHLFNASNPTVSVDNAAWRELYADASKRLGYFDLPAMTTGADSTNSDMSRSLDMGLRHRIQAASGGRNIYALLETLDAFTPTSGQSFTLSLAVAND